MINRKWIQRLGLLAMVVGVLLLSIPWVRSDFQPTPTPAVEAGASTNTSTYTPMPMSTDTPTPTPTGGPSPTNTPTPTPTATPTPTPSAVPSSAASPSTATPTATSTTTRTPTCTATSTPTDTPTPTHAATPQLTGPITLTIYLRDTLAETGVTALSGDQVNGGEIYQEKQTVYGDAAVQIGETTYHFDKPLPAPWQVEFEFDQLLVARTGNQAGFNAQKAQFWVGTLDGDSAVGEDRPYSLTMKLYEGNALRESIQVFFTVKDAPEVEPGPPPTSTPRSRPSKYYLQ